MCVYTHVLNIYFGRFGLILFQKSNIENQKNYSGRFSFAYSN